MAFNLEHKGSRNPDNNLVGILFESKDHEYHMNYTNTNIGDVIIDFLKYNNLESIEKSKDTVPIILMSFYAETVKVFFEKSDLPRVQLVQRTWFPFSIRIYIYNFKRRPLNMLPYSEASFPCYGIRKRITLQ